MWEQIASGLFGSVLNNLFSDEKLWQDFGIKNQNYINWERQQEVNKENWNRQAYLNQLNIDNAWQMWKASNEYNSPMAQMQRYRDAGLNPNLIYGQTNTTSPVSIPTAQNTESKSYSSEGNPLERFSNLVMQLPQVREQYKILKEQRKQEEIKTDSDRLKNAYLGMEYFKHQIDNAKYMTLFNADGRLTEYLDSWMKAEIENTKSSKLKNDLLNAQRAFYSIRKDFETAKLKWYDSNPLTNSRGIWELERDLKDTLSNLKFIDLDYAERMKNTRLFGEYGSLFLNLLKFLKK